MTFTRMYSPLCELTSSFGLWPRHLKIDKDRDFEEEEKINFIYIYIFIHKQVGRPSMRLFLLMCKAQSLGFVPVCEPAEMSARCRTGLHI